MASPWCFDETDLSASFDDSMSGIGTDFMFNMRDALSALPVCDEPIFVSDEPEPQSHREVARPDASGDAFDNILKAQTSSVTRFTETSLTYLNQGQTYELILHCNLDRMARVKSLIRVRFHDYRMEQREQGHMIRWQQEHANERMLDIDLSHSHGYDDLQVDGAEVNTVLCIWNRPQCTVSVRVNCVSTEFTAKQHGGEKGIPFRLQVDHFDAEDDQHLDSYASQVKVFKSKGADRKHRTDREKIDRKCKDGQALYKPSLPITKLARLRLSTSTTGLHQILNSVPHSPVETGDRLITSQLSDALSVVDEPIARNKTGTDSDETADTSETRNVLLSSAQIGLTTPSPDLNSTVTVPLADPFITPPPPPPLMQRPTRIRARRSSPGPQLSPSPNRRLSATVATNPRRRRHRAMDYPSCLGTCSSCGRGCRSSNHTGGRWARVSKPRPCCSRWEADTTRSRQQPFPPSPSPPPALILATSGSTNPITSSETSLGLSEKRRASCSFERGSMLSCPQKVDRLTSTLTSCPSPAVLRPDKPSTSAKPQFLNTIETNKKSLDILKRDEDAESSDSAPGGSVVSAEVQLNPPNSDISSRDGGYSSDRPPSHELEPACRKMMRTMTMESATGSRTADVSVVIPATATYAIPHASTSIAQWIAPSAVTSVTSRTPRSIDQAVRLVNPDTPEEVVMQPLLGRMATPTYIHANMTPADVEAWLRRSHFDNLVDTFGTFSGLDVLRLTKEDFLTLCGSVEGLRLHNALLDKPTRPRCTIYVSSSENVVYQAIILHELSRNELLRHLAPMVSVRPDQIHMLCVLTTHGLPVWLNDELVKQFADQSCYQIEVRWSFENKSNIFMRLVEQVDFTRK